MNRSSTILITLLLSSLSLQAQDFQAQIAQKATALLPKVIEWRRYLHEHPELSNRETKTAEYVAAHLRSLGIEVQTGIAKTGVVGLLKGGKPGPVVALRADMDALPVLEKADVPFKSTVTAEYLGQTVPVMHACGHDSHVAILMGTAEVLAAMKKDIPGTVKFIFQPAEEGPPGTEEGGAPLMVKEGVMENPVVDAIFGLHISSSIEIGKIQYKQGAMMASSDWFTIAIKGKPSHGSSPWNSIDPIVVGTQIINGLQTIVSRQANIVDAPVVITVGKFHSGVRSNIIPEEALLEGTIRTLDSKMQTDVHERIRRTATKIAEASNAQATVTIDKKTLVTFNDSALVSRMLPSLQKAAGSGKVSIMNWVTGAEDFSFYGTKAPAFFFYLGGMPKGKDPKQAPSHHTPDFYIDDSMLDVGVKAFCNLVFDYKKK
ncbi:amidohydrolase [Chitinophaga niabensis]|uniref:Carboxypeptidase Ss1. Metallo peptidase. MEROPS family M20D n=1 Tax=Chitinophaga niabensis TaxID=536979 RepID=A0A1N6D1L1_9BACT|nr:amidohydrolase [Chitinophaga niabensis]SIN64702.1 carboxypeptidase Ss1. Metallo peptidase. MEROPS family M20D [Chitinophaga niabensis]